MVKIARRERRKCSAAVTDGRVAILAEWTDEPDEPDTPDLDLLIPAAIWTLALTSTNDGYVILDEYMAHEKNQVRFICGGYEIQCPKGAGMFPSFDTVMPTYADENSVVSFDTKLMLAIDHAIGDRLGWETHALRLGRATEPALLMLTDDGLKLRAAIMPMTIHE
jgi:hypothetical protein